MKQKTWRRPAPVKEAPAVQVKSPESAPPAESSRWRPHAWRILALWVITLAAYSNSFRGGLVFDNQTAIQNDTRIRALTSENLHLILNQELWYNSSTTGLYRPLTTFSFLVNYAIFGNGTETAGYHWVNFALHAVNVLLVYLLGLLLLEEATLAWALAGLWGVHPLLTESVTNLVGRADLLAGFGVLAGLLCHVQASRSSGRRRIQWLVALAAAAGIGIFSKESAAVLPAMMLLYDLTWARAARWSQRWRGYATLLIPFGIFFKLRADMLAGQLSGLVPFLDNPLMGVDFLTARLTAFKVIGKYVWLFLWPNRLSADYSYNAVPLFGWTLDRWQDIAAVLALAGCLAAAAFALRSYRDRKPVFFFILFFFIALAPVANIFLLIGTIMAERFLYLPAVGIAGCLVIAIFAAARRLGAPKAAWVLMLLLCGAFATRTFFRNFDWRDERTIGASTIASVPNSFKAQQLLVSSRLDARPPEVDAAIQGAERMQAILDPLPDDQLTSRPYYVIGLAYRLKGDSLAGASPATNIWYRKALAALERGRQVDRLEIERIRQINLAHGRVAIATGWVPLYLELGRVYRLLGDPQKAIEAWTFGRLRRPDEEFSEAISQTRLAMGNGEQAAVALMEGLVLNPGSNKLPSDLVALYRQTAPDTCAANPSGINLQCPMVHGQLCTASRNVALAYAGNGLRTKAATTARSAIQSLGCPAELFR